MDRGFDRDRRPPVPQEDRYGTSRGQSYRPGRSPPPVHPPPRSGFRPRSPPRGPGFGDGYSPRGYAPRPRSRSPPYRRRSRSPPRFGDRPGDGFRSRPRSPPRRDFDRDGGYRGAPPPRDMRDEGRFRERTPPRNVDDRTPLSAKRSRDVSPISSRGRYSPPPPKRERLASPERPRPPEAYGARERSPPRRRFSPPRDRRPSPIRSIGGDHLRARSPPRQSDRSDARPSEARRRRSPSPRRPGPFSGSTSNAPSASTSRRASPPPIHPSRLAVIGDQVLRTGRDDPNPTPTPRQSPAPAQIPNPSSPPGRRVSPSRGPAVAEIKSEFADRPPPFTPSGPRVPADFSAAERAPPTGPKPVQSSISVPPRPTQAQADVSSPRTEFPTGPRAHGGVPVTSSYRGGRGGFPPGGPARDFEPTSQAPSGPRSGGPPPAGPFRTPSTSSTPTYPRGPRYGSTSGPPTGPAQSVAQAQATAARRVTHPQFASLSPILDEGKKLPDLYDRARLDRLEEEAERMRKGIEEKQARKRKGLAEWARLEREVRLAALRSEVAEESLARLSEGEGGMAAF